MKTNRAPARVICSLFAAGLWACDGDNNPDAGNNDMGTAADSGMVADSGPADTGGNPDMGTVDTGNNGATNFTVTIENISGDSVLPGPFSPGAWVMHSQAAPLFNSGMADRGEGLVEIAEDGNPGVLGPNLPAGMSGVFNTPDGEQGPGPLFPGMSYSFTFEGSPSEPNLSFATMLVQTNDVFLAPGEAGIPLYDGNGEALDPGDITASLTFWDVGSEADQAPGQGSAQAPRQSGPNVGRAPGVIGPFAESTRTIPTALDIADVTVTENGGVYSLSLENVSGDRGALVSVIAPVFWAVHDENYRLFELNTPDEGEGLEVLAEDGSPAMLVATQEQDAGTLAVGASVTTDERPMDPPGPAMPGEHFSFDVTPDADHPYLTIAAMVVESNDAFLAFHPAGVRLLDEQGNPRAAEMVAADIRRSLAVWDAGTEANEVPGVGANQAPRQAGPNTGDVDPNQAVRIYADPVNDLEGEQAGGLVNITVTETMGDFEITVENASAGSAFPGIITPIVWAVHQPTVGLFAEGEAASEGVERVAEDGNPMPLAMALSSVAEVGSSGAMAIPNGEMNPGPAFPGASYTFTVTPDATNRILSFISMVVPSNDTFFGTPPAGVELMDAQGAMRTAAEVEADLRAVVAAWDAGTEANQAGAGGRDQAPRQAAADTGAAEEAALVQPVATDSVWSYPNPQDVVRVTIQKN